MSTMNSPASPSRSRRAVALLATALVLAVGPLTTIGAQPASALDNGVAITPPMGWNTWNSFGCGISEQLIRTAADNLVSSGMKDAGYDTVIVDDCWFDPQRDAQGNIHGDPVRFPGGMKALGDYIHSKGLKFGIYEVPTDKTCAQRQTKNPYPGATGSQGHEQQDADSFAAWGVDYLKYDWCSPDKTLDQQVAAFSTMRDALHNTGRQIVYSINPNSFHADKTGATYDWSAVANMWRTTEDISADWDQAKTSNSYSMGVMDIVGYNGRLGSQAGPGHWNDPDMMEVGVGSLSDPVLARSHFSLWAQMASPLVAGNKLTTMTSDIKGVLTNHDVIAVDQDSLGRQARIVTDSDTQLLTVRELAGGDRSVTLTNTGASTATVSTTVAELGIAGAPSYTVKNLWTGASSSTTGALSASLASHETAMYRITPGGTISTVQAPPADGTYEIASATSPAQVIDDPNSSLENSKQLLTWDRNNNDNQRWILTANPDGTYAVKNKVSGKCFDIRGGSTAAGAAVIQYTCDSAKPNQKFALTPAGNNGYKLVAQSSGLAVTPSGSVKNSVLTQQPVATGQAWTLIRTS
ncbi:alpha-galactosidase [Kitasatospora herbaricolor]|uniref:alpha-galactosidase n=1 Tax=Kitasatospora herbaricolor TaxID=68217 RepID=UPI001996313E|nr:alpha-galactosidase [Kitasatospora herbaricolor]MDQ0312468.1 alpha-galactosidase [Kitasatospora herbaricolor]GGV48893.1 alpha-galactosidase [Kitasatospora herbaricolor]